MTGTSGLGDIAFSNGLGDMAFSVGLGDIALSMFPFPLPLNLLSFLLFLLDRSPFGPGVNPLIGVIPLKSPPTLMSSSSIILLAFLNVSADALMSTPQNWV